MPFYPYSFKADEDLFYFSIPETHTMGGLMCNKQYIVNFGGPSVYLYQRSVNTYYQSIQIAGLHRFKRQYGSVNNTQCKVRYRSGIVQLFGPTQTINLKISYSRIMDISETAIIYLDRVDSPIMVIKSMDIYGNVTELIKVRKDDQYTAAFVRGEIIYLRCTSNEENTIIHARLPNGQIISEGLPPNYMARLVDEYLVIDDKKTHTTKYIYDPVGKKIEWKHENILFYGEMIITKTAYNESSLSPYYNTLSYFVTKINLLTRGANTKIAKRAAYDEDDEY